LIKRYTHINIPIQEEIDMSTVTKIKRTFEKGLVILADSRPDGISVHTATILGNKIQSLDKAHIASHDNLIYLVGHGNLQKRTISKLSMQEIAKRLEKAGYNGNQKLYVTSCEFMSSYRGSSMYEELCKELESLKISSKNVESDSNGEAIYIERNGIVEMRLVQGNSAKLSWESLNQKFLITAYNYYYNAELISAAKLSSNDKKLRHIEKFKEHIIVSLGGREEMDLPDEKFCYWRFSLLYGALAIGGLANISLGVIIKEGISLPKHGWFIYLAIMLLLILKDIKYVRDDNIMQNLVSWIIGGLAVAWVTHLITSKLFTGSNLAMMEIYIGGALMILWIVLVIGIVAYCLIDGHKDKTT
jgi:hypothetical protein